MNTSLPSAILRHTLAAAVLALTGASAFAQAPATTTPAATPAAKPIPPADKKFLKDVAKSFYLEIQFAEYAKGNAKSEATKKYAVMVNTELNKAWEGLGEIAKAKGEMLPAELTGGDKGAFERFKKMKDDGVDKMYFREVLKEAKGVERDLTSASKTSADPAIKAFAAEYLPTVKNHVTEGEKAEKESNKRTP